MRPVEPENAMRSAHHILSGNRVSDGFNILADKKHLELSLEALHRQNHYFSEKDCNST